MDRKKVFKQLKDLIIISFGTSITAFGVVNFAATSNLASGGLVGVTLILYHIFDLGTGLTTLIFNIPLFIIYYRYSSKRVFLLTVYGVLSLAGFLWLFETIGPVMPDLQNDMIVAALGFGATMGLGTGIVLKREGTTGGIVVVGKLLKEKFNIPVAKSMLYSDAMIIGTSLFLYVTILDGIYSIIAIFISAMVLTKVQEGFLSGYKVLIFSKKYQAIGEAIKTKLNRGATYIQGTGAYTNTERKVLLVIVDKKQLMGLKQIVNEIDDGSFVSVSHTYETLGEGFTIDQRIAHKTVEDDNVYEGQIGF